MGHTVNADREYRLLQQRLDRYVTGAPDSPTLMKILRLLFSPEEAELARQIPGRPTPLSVLSAKLGIPGDELAEKMTEMARRGVIFDLEHGGEHYFSLPPVVIGFFEFTFMRAREELPMAELAGLFDEYMTEDDRFARAVFQGETQVGRSLVREEALPEDGPTEVLDFERASRVVGSASAIGVSLCVCRHKASHLGKACQRPQRCCLSLNYSAEAMIRMGNAEPVSADEAMRILADCKEAGLAQTGDNVRRKVAYLCNCCGCCCGMIEAIKRFDIRGAIASSNWIMEVDPSRCKGCGKCAAACPVGAIAIAERSEGQRTRKGAVCDQTLCLGCAVCYSACKSGGVAMKPRQSRVFTPETLFDRVAAMAIERGKLAETLFEDPQKLSHRALGRLVGVLEKSPVFKAAMAIRPLRSAFLRGVVREAKRSLGEIGRRVG